ncbi:kinase-like protein [Aspergillus stella-maris]|uniref:kinase-like protein n=1 Tax=Aspergillus stella-maris TaxID=1810926 RepID=UPI003CCD6313
MQDLSIYRQNTLLYSQEALSRYQPGGYHPVSLGDTFQDGRYRVHHKLGWGGFSTVWLVHDKEANQWVPLKVMTADSLDHPRELENLHLLANYAKGNLATNHIVQLLDEFTHEGPNGVHRCLVFELLGPSLDKVIAGYHDSQYTFEPETVLRISKQFLEGLKFIHDAGLGRGDLSGGNVAFRCSGLTNADEDEVMEILGRPEVEDLIRLDGEPLAPGLPSQIVKATRWEEWFEEDLEDIRILDFGEAFLQSDQPITKLAQPAQLRIPETFFVERFDHRVDLYRAGYVLYALVRGPYPFQYLGDDDDLEQIKLVSNHPLLVDEIKEGKPPELQRRIEERVGDASLACLIPIMTGLMKFLLAERMAASEALDLLADIQESEEVELETDDIDV